jgi:O-antigen/teichoic acid export membrane protein
VAFAGGVYLARTLGPDLYGVVVLATTVIIYGARISDCGVDLLGVADVAATGRTLARSSRTGSVRGSLSPSCSSSR